LAFRFKCIFLHPPNAYHNFLCFAMMSVHDEIVETASLFCENGWCGSFGVRHPQSARCHARGERTEIAPHAVRWFLCSRRRFHFTSNFQTVQVRRQWGGQWCPALPFEIGAPPFYIWARGSRILSILYFKNVPPLLLFGPPCC